MRGGEKKHTSKKKKKKNVTDGSTDEPAPVDEERAAPRLVVTPQGRRGSVSARSPSLSLNPVLNNVAVCPMMKSADEVKGRRRRKGNLPN